MGPFACPPGGCRVAGIVIPVPVRIIVGCALALVGAFTVGDLAFTIALFAMSVLFIVWAIIEAPMSRGDR